jgi:hypothetical protein
MSEENIALGGIHRFFSFFFFPFFSDEENYLKGEENSNIFIGKRKGFSI